MEGNIMTERHCFALDLHDDPETIAAYRRWHAPGGPPLAVTQSIRRAGILDMQIWLTGPRLFMIMETGPDFAPEAKAAADAADPDVQAWEALMGKLQKALPWAAPGEKWTPAERIFNLAEQP
jgi:L-rhamnose mutarotase